ncbi:MAG: MBL fold metallo-hydrolase [Solirubrobacteraceae bacterium]
MVDYSIWLLEYARITGYPTGAMVYGVHDGSTRVLPFTFFALKSEDHLILIDTGYEDNAFTRGATELWGMQHWTAPEKVLGRLGFAPEDVDTIIITHHHFDHAANLRAFPNATMYVQKLELTSFMEKLAAPKRNSWLASGLDPGTMAQFADVAADGRLRLLDGPANILSGIDVRPAFDTHTAGSQYVVISAGDAEPWIIAGDAVMCDENLLGMNFDGVMVPIGLAQGGQASDIWVMEEMMQLVGDKSERILQFHEVRQWDRHPCHQHADGLHIAEIAVADGASSRLDKTMSGLA